MVAVERAVRPVRSSGRRKDRMREELLAHLTASYEEEFARLGDENAARAEAIRRFGEPAALTAELQASVPLKGWVEYQLERWFGWHAPESAVRYTFRLAVLILIVSVVLSTPVVLAVALSCSDFAIDGLTRLRIGGTFLLVMSVDVFLLGLLYYKMRDALLGRMEVRRSLLRATGFALLFGLVLFTSGPAIAVLSLGDVASGVWLVLPDFLILASVGLGFALFYALVNGPAEIRHTEWECLDIGVAA
jgi:hypothetical protein